MNQARILVLFLAVLLCPFWGARAEGSLPAGLQETQAEETARRAQELLDLSKLQNSENHALALETARQSLALWQTTDDRAGLARAYAQVAKCLLAQSDVAEAVENFQQALALWRQLDERREQAGALGMLGLAQTRGGEWAGALTAFTEAQSLFVEEDEPVFMGLIASGLAHVFNETGLPERGLEQYQRALEFYGRGGTPRDVA
ncbi:MAG TPA: tetratricopeptide repeat protein, partial [Pyrinomonadaceae bacterium]|nr:tetratricopeptide repeat protein [Pyrinomonadaceae bacterium]